MYRHLIVPTDGTETGRRAVDQGLDLARAFHAKLTILTVYDDYAPFSLLPKLIADPVGKQGRELEAHRLADEFLEMKVRDSGVDCAHVEAENSHLGEAVRRAAEAGGCDLVVMPAHDHFGLTGRHVDGETLKLLTESQLAVLVVH
jgi:nucleotide-binding universal stress UspA family protein